MLFLFFMKNFLSLPFLILLCLTLGLAPFTPEPHIVGKLRWVAGGAVGMGAIDWFDLFLHGTPWMLLFGKLGYLISRGKGLRG